MDHVINISINIIFVFFFKSLLLWGIIKVLKPKNKSIWLKIKPIKKLLTLSFSYQHIVNKISTIWNNLSTYPRILDLLYSSNLCYYEELLNCSNSQTWAFSWKLSQMKSYKLCQLVTIMLRTRYQQFESSYQHIQEN